jgi:DNA-binding beta-propeller fold protein YncE
LSTATVILAAAPGMAAAAYPVTATIPLTSEPYDVAVDPSNHNVYVTGIVSGYTGVVSVIDEAGNADSGTVVDSIPFPQEPTAMAVDPSTHDLYVDSEGSDYDNTPVNGTISVIDESGDADNGKVTATIPIVGAYAYDVALDPSNHNLYVGYQPFGGLPGVMVIDADNGKVTATIPVGGGIPRIAVDPSNHNVYVTDYAPDTASQQVSVIDESGDADNGKVTANILIPPNLNTELDTIAVDPSNHNVYVANDGTFPATVSVIDESGDATTNTVTATIPLAGSGSIYNMAVDPSNHNVYVTRITKRYNDDPKEVSVIDESGDAATNSVTATIVVGQDLQGVAVDPSNHNVYVGDSALGVGFSGTLSVINASPQTLADVSLTVAAPPSAPDETQFTETAVVANYGPAAAANITTNLLIPDGVTVTDAPGAITTSGTLVWHQPSLAAGRSVTYQVAFTVDADAGTDASIGGIAEPIAQDPNPGNNIAVSTVQLGTVDAAQAAPGRPLARIAGKSATDDADVGGEFFVEVAQESPCPAPRPGGGVGELRR